MDEFQFMRIKLKTLDISKIPGPIGIKWLKCDRRPLFFHAHNDNIKLLFLMVNRYALRLKSYEYHITMPDAVCWRGNAGVFVAVVLFCFDFAFVWLALKTSILIE